MPASHPTLALITINVIDFYNFCRSGERNTDVNIVGHDEPKDGMMTVFVACANEEIKTLLIDGWR